MIKQYTDNGRLVPMELIVKLLEVAIKAALQEGRSGEGWANGKGRFLVDGFPREMDQALKFDEDVRWISDVCPAGTILTPQQVCLSSKVLFYTTTEEVMLKRLLKRGETSGRGDDNEETIKKRFRE